MAEEVKKSPRWWEFYFVRYFVGTVVGFVIVVFLLFESTSPLNGSNFLGKATIQDLTGANVLLLSGVGLAFCYISSAPILVFHALRSAYEYPEKWWQRTIFGPVLVVIASVAIVLMAVAKLSGYDLGPTLAYVFVLAVVAVQVYLYWKIFCGGKPADKFYDRLTECRAKAGSEDVEYMESYRHLREHGNAFLILVFESGLGASMYLMDTSGHALATVLLWIVPAPFVWFVATHLEYKFTEREPRDAGS